jgi:hypothetical protein
MSKYLIGVLIVSLASYAAPAAAGDFFQNVGNAAEKTARDTGKTMEKAVQDTGNTVEKAVQDTGHALEKSSPPDTSEWMAIDGEQGGAQVIPVDSRRHKM